jgi:hypothetical protein
MPGVAGPHPTSGIPMARVKKTEEKGSDVNLATYLLLDGFNREYEVAVVISNDSDLEEPIKVVHRELKRKVGIFNPHQHPSQELLREATFHRQITPAILASSQFSNTLTDAIGRIRKPSTW